MTATDHLNQHQFPIVEHDAGYTEPGWRQLVAYRKGAPEDEENDLGQHQIGLLSYRNQGTHVDIGNRRVHQDHRFQGVASSLQTALERRHPNKDLVSEPGLSQDAYDMREAYIAKHPDSRWRVGQ